ncbi:hypothetical protein LEN26_009860 [Aphanomyces euteiches]|nr:hypothetical protein AeMF1_010883 [Aphanomyces euteiches]KAH9123674.1 hypothetical protein LEN26_009860 [Aphanomyces euteiches]
MSAHKLPDSFQKMRIQHIPADNPGPNNYAGPPSGARSTSSAPQSGGLYHPAIPIVQRGSNPNLYAMTSPHQGGSNGGGYLPQRGSSQDLYSQGAPQSTGRDLIAAAAMASQKNRQLRSRTGNTSTTTSPPSRSLHEQAYYKTQEAAPLSATAIRKNHSWNSGGDSLLYEDPSSAIRPRRSQTGPPSATPSGYPSTYFGDVDEDDSSSIGYTDEMEMKQNSSYSGQGFDRDDEEDEDDEQEGVDNTSFAAPEPKKYSNISVQHHHRQVNYGPHQPSGPSRNQIPSSPPAPGRSVAPPPPPQQPHVAAVLEPRIPLQHSTSNGKDEYSSSGVRQDGDISIWVGTWNLGAADPFSDSRGLMDDSDTARMVRHLVPLGYDLYVLGVQEGVNENVYFAIQAYLNRNPQLLRYHRKELRNDKVVFPNKQAPVDAVFDAVRGRGDGAFMGTKFTGMAVFCGEHVSADVQVLRAGVHKFNIASGSKGGVAVALKLKQTTVCFLNCHLDARNDTYRREQIRLLNTNLGKVMGNPHFDLTEQFHHIVWMGDLNYRIVKMDATEVLDLLRENRIQELHERGDGLLNDRSQGIFEGFVEPTKFLNFYPTYKKFPLRGLINMDDSRWPEQVYRVLYKEPFYKGKYISSMEGEGLTAVVGGQVKKRVPGWCDRILIHSTPIRTSNLVPEKVLCPFIEGRWVDNYQSINDGVGMDVSDHSPVTCTLLLKFSRPNLAARNEVGGSFYRNVAPQVTATDAMGASYTDLRPSVRFQGPSYAGGPHGPITTILTLFNMIITWNNIAHVPKKCRVVAPLLGEDDLNKQTEAMGERSLSVTNLFALSLNVKLHHERSLQDLHMMIWVRHETVVGHCMISLRRVAELQTDGIEEARYKSKLYYNGAPVMLDNDHVKVIFSVKLNHLQGVKAH